MIPKRLTAVACAVVLALAAVALASPAAAGSLNDPYYPKQWALTKIGAQKAWATGKHGEGVVVAVVDSGVNHLHPDLFPNVLRTRGWNTVTNRPDGRDVTGHGTSVAGVIAAAANNKQGIVGAAFKSKIMPVAVFKTNGRADANDTAEGIRWAVDHGADVINLSLGAEIVGGDPENPLPFAPSELEAVMYAAQKGVLVIAAAGNAHNPICGAPAIFPTVICVGSTTIKDAIAGFSNYGVRLDIVAPGQIVLTTSREGSYIYVDGTSISAPYVSAVGAQLIQMGASAPLAGLILRASSKDLGLPGYDLTFGFGRLDAKKALDMCAQLC